MKHTNSTEQYNYWPGYVDALTNIVLNLLFLVAVFVAGVAALSLVVVTHEERISALQSKQMQHGVKSTLERIVLSSKGDLKKPETPVVFIEKVMRNDKGITAKIHFQSDQFVLTEKEETQLFKHIAQEFETNTRVLISAASREEDALQIRGAMVRLLSIRNMLIRNGVDAKTIEVKIVAVGSAKPAEANVDVEIKKEMNDVLQN
jgi:outer membrane protein OmpA-like peptidoglycan-associated protein